MEQKRVLEIRRSVRRRTSDKILISPRILGIVLMIFCAGIGTGITIALQQVIQYYDAVHLRDDPSAIHSISLFPLCLIALAIGWFAGQSASWIMADEKIVLSGTGLGLAIGFIFYQILTIAATGSNYYLIVVGVMTVLTFGTFFATDGLEKMRRMQMRVRHSHKA